MAKPAPRRAARARKSLAAPPKAAREPAPKRAAAKATKAEAPEAIRDPSPAPARDPGADFIRQVLTPPAPGDEDVQHAHLAERPYLINSRYGEDVKVAYEHRRTGLWAILRIDDNEPEEHHLTGPFRVLSSVADADGNRFGFRIQAATPSGLIEFTLDNTTALSGAGIKREFAARRIRVSNDMSVHQDKKDKRKKVTRYGLLTHYFQAIEPDSHRVRVGTSGWHERNGRWCYAFPNGRIVGGDAVIFAARQPNHPRFRSAGTLDQWKRDVAAPCERNSRLVLALCTAAGGPFIRFSKVFLNGGYNLFGRTGCGKTTAMAVAGSVWGLGGTAGQIRGWNATPLGIEEMAKEASDSVLILDELKHSVKPADAVEIIYNIANTDTRTTARSPRVQQEWRSLMLVTCEFTIPSRLGPRHTTPGLEPRIPDIPAVVGIGDAGKPTSFEDTGGMTHAEFADAMQHRAATVYGTAGPRLVEVIAEWAARDEAGLRRRIDEGMAEWMRARAAKTADSVEQRVAQRMAFVAACGEIAAEAGVLPWKKGSASKGVAACWTAWLQHRRSGGTIDYAGAAQAVRDFIARHPGRFTELDDGKVPPNHVGWIERGEGGRIIYWHIRDTAFPAVLGPQHEPRTSARKLLEAELLLPSREHQRLARKLETAPANFAAGHPKDRPRVYTIVAAKLHRGGDD